MKKNQNYASKEALKEMLDKSAYRDRLINRELKLKIFFSCQILETFKNEDLSEKGFINFGVKVTKCDLVPALVGLNLGALCVKPQEGEEPLKVKDLVSGSMDMEGQTWLRPRRTYLSKDEKKSIVKNIDNTFEKLLKGLQSLEEDDNVPF